MNKLLNLMAAFAFIFAGITFATSPTLAQYYEHAYETDSYGYYDTDEYGYDDEYGYGDYGDENNWQYTDSWYEDDGDFDSWYEDDYDYDEWW